MKRKMNNQSKLSRQILYAIANKDDLVLDKVYPLYNRYLRKIGRDNTDWFLLEKVNTIYVDYKKAKYLTKNDWLDWIKEDGKDLERNIKMTLL